MRRAGSITVARGAFPGPKSRSTHASLVPMSCNHPGCVRRSDRGRSERAKHIQEILKPRLRTDRHHAGSAGGDHGRRHRALGADHQAFRLQRVARNSFRRLRFSAIPRANAVAPGNTARPRNASLPTQAMSAVRNILFIMCDQLRADHLGCYGHPFLATTHLDQLARRGVRFGRAFVQSGVCGPSRMSFYTGRYVASHGATWNRVPLSVGEITLGEYFKRAGRKLSLAGKSHVTPDTAGIARLHLDGDEEWMRLIC